MDLSTLLNSALRLAVSVGKAFLDILPPYLRIEGHLVAKERGPEGKYYLLVNEEMIEVDWHAYDRLIIGEPLRVRCTRSNKAINIDRLVP